MVPALTYAGTIDPYRHLDPNFFVPSTTRPTSSRPRQGSSTRPCDINSQMPRRKAADRTGPVKTRSRDGCKECRAGRVRCDTKKPRCTRCWEKGLPCTKNLVL